jgi:hypothetical protein
MIRGERKIDEKTLGITLAVLAFVIAAVVATGVRSSSPRHHHTTTPMSWEGCEEEEEANGQYTAVVGKACSALPDGTAAASKGAALSSSSRILRFDDGFVRALQTGKHAYISSPFHMITTLPYASVPLELEARAEGGDQCNRQLRAKDEALEEKTERIKANEEMLEEKDKMLQEDKTTMEEKDRVIAAKNSIIKVTEQALRAAQGQPGMTMAHYNNSGVARGQSTGARRARKNYHRTLARSSSTLLPLHIDIAGRIHVEGAVQLWKALPLEVSVDVASGSDSSSCIPTSVFSSSAPTSTPACKTIRYALEYGQIAARKTSRPLALAVSHGVYLGECSDEGIAVTIATTIKKAGGSTGVVKINCEKKGKAFNVTQTPTSTFHLEGLTIANGKSARGGAAFVEGGSMVLKGCTFDDLESLASSADGDFVGGGAFMFVVSWVLDCVSAVESDHSLFLTFVQGAVRLYSEGCSFHNCRAASGAGGGILVSFHALDGSWAAAAYALTILGSQFDRCGAGSSGGAVAAVAGEGVARVDVLIGSTTFDGSWLRSAGSSRLKGGHLYFSYLGDASNTNTTLQGCHFTNGLMSSTATSLVEGGCYLEYRAAATNVYQQVEACVFENNTLTGGGVHGGGVMLVMNRVSTNMTILFELCSFLSNVLQGKGGRSSAYGGGVYIQFPLSTTVRSVLLLISRCIFERNLLTASRGGGASGGGLKMQIAADATDVTSTFDRCSFAHNILRAEVEGGEANGGGISLAWFGFTAGGMLTSLLDSTFVGNRLAGGTGADSDSYGGAVDIFMQTTSAYTGPVRTLVDRCRFLANVVEGGGANSQGGAIDHGTTQPGAFLHVRQSVIRGNSAGLQGAGIYVEQSEATPPTNLEMIVTPRHGEVPPFDCNPNSSAANGHSRQYGYGSHLLIESSTIDSNIVISGDSTGTGAGFFALNVNITVRSSSIDRNKVDGTGGGITVAGTARLTLVGGTSVKDNDAFKAGTAIFSSSAGDITLGDGTKLGFRERAGISAIAIQSGSKFEQGSDAALQCRSGERLLYDVSTAPATFSTWVINCDSVLAEANGTRLKFSAPTCKQLQLGNSPLHTKQCENLPLQPAMLSASGTISCSPCPNNQYSLEGGMMRGGKLHPIKCRVCPYGANCELGGAKIKTKANFWAEETMVTEAVPTATPTAAPTASTLYDTAPTVLAHTTTLAMVTCPEGYCCANRSAGCAWNSDDACQGNRSRKYPLCGGCQQHFSQAIDGVGCVADAECGGDGIMRYILLQLFVVWAGSDAYSLFAARYPPLLAPLPSFLRPAACNSGAVAVVIYFGQMVMVAVPNGYDSLMGKAAATAGELSTMQQLMLSYQGGACPWKGMSTVHKLVWQLCLPLVLFLLLPIVAKLAPLILRFIAAFGRFIGCCQNDRNHDAGRTGPDKAELMDTEGTTNIRSAAAVGRISRRRLTEPLLKPAAEVDENGVHYEQDQEQQEGQQQDSQEVPTQWGAVACLALFSFTGFAEGTLQLVNCVEVNRVRVLFYAGAVECKVDLQFALLYLLLAILLLGPLYVVLLQLSAHCPLLSFVPHPPAAVMQWKSLRALRQHATEPFKGGSWQWTAVLMLQRLLTVMCQALSTKAIASSLGVTVISFFFTLLQLLVRPYRVSRVNDLQLLASVCLTFISVLNAAQSAFESAGVDADQDPALASLVRTTDLLMFLLLLPPPLMLMYHTFQAVCACDGKEKEPAVDEDEDEETAR